MRHRAGAGARSAPSSRSNSAMSAPAASTEPVEFVVPDAGPGTASMISIVVCTRDRPRPLARLLQSLSGMQVPGDLNWEVVIVDNNDDGGAHADATRRVVREFEATLPLTLLHEPEPGHARARNRAIEWIGPHRHTLWTDDDVAVPDNWLSVYERAFRYWPQFSFFGGPVRARFEGEPPPWTGTAARLFPEVFAHIDPSAEFAELGEGAAFLPFGANMAFRAGTFERLRFDPRLGRQPGTVLRGGDEQCIFRRLTGDGACGLWLPPAGVENWIGPERQTLRWLYDHGLGDGFLDELLDVDGDPDAAVAAVSGDALDRLFGARRARLAVGTPPSQWLPELHQGAVEDGRRLAWEVVPDHYRVRRRKKTRPLLVVCLDGFVASLADEMVAAGELPGFKALHEDSARFELDHGDALLTGLAWEHFSTGYAPADYGRFSAIDFDVDTYRTRQRGTRERTFVDGLEAHTVVFDVPYFDLAGTRNVSGLTSWGAHDPGTPRRSKPVSLEREIAGRFGDYPARDWIYGFVWPSVERAAEMGRLLAESVRRRGEICRWLFSERFTSWDLAMVTMGEFHSAVEGLWHGVDRGHPLHAAPSAVVAGEGIRAVFRAADSVLGELRAEFPGVDLLVFSPHGMGGNRSDVSTMLLLPELMFRRAFGCPAFEPRADWHGADPAAMLAPGADWSQTVNRQITLPEQFAAPDANDLGNLAFMPAAHYQPAWHMMDAFALPSLYDGRIRINLRGRERQGRVPLEQYGALCEHLVDTLMKCRDHQTGETVVDHVRRYDGPDPLRLDATDCDLKVRWKSPTVAIDHPDYGRVGPAPWRRPGGHRGFGAAWLVADGIAPGDYGRRSTFDVVPTIMALLGEQWTGRSSGKPLACRGGV